MRDAIQGMLSMSQMGGLSGLSLAATPDPFELPKNRSGTRPQRDQRAVKRKYVVEEDGGERMPTCFNDEEYSKYLHI